DGDDTHGADSQLPVPLCPGVSSGAQIPAAKYPTDSVVVAVKNLADYRGIDAQGGADMTGLVTQAMADVVAAGGGTLWIPAGTYRFDHPLAVPPSVTLRGDWKQPTKTDMTVGGTIFKIKYVDG